MHLLATSDPSTDISRHAYFGETHFHTAFSLDSYIGDNRITPDMAYRFAKGEAFEVHGVLKQLKRPLDFAAVSDHAEYIGETYSTMTLGAPGYDNEDLRDLRNLSTLEEKRRWFLTYVVGVNGGSKPEHPSFYAGLETVKSAWKIIVDAAEKNYEPGKFTTLIGFKWSGAPNGSNLHRVVLFRGSEV